LQALLGAHHILKVLAVHAKKAYRGDSRIVPLTLELDTIRRRLVNFTSWSLYPRENNRRSLDRRLGAPQDVSEEKILPLPEFEPWTAHPAAYFLHQFLGYSEFNCYTLRKACYNPQTKYAPVLSLVIRSICKTQNT